MSSIAIIGSSDLWVTPDVAITVATLILATPEGSEIRIRAKTEGMPPRFTSSLEGFVFAFAMKSGRVAHALSPEYLPRSGKKLNVSTGEVFKRDMKLITELSTLYAFLSPGASESRYRGGTFGLVQLAINNAVPTEAWTINDLGDLEDVGSSISQEEAPLWLFP